MAFNRLAQLLGGGQLNLTPSPQRSAMIQALMAQSMQQQPMAQSPIEGLNIAAKPILAAALARRERKAQQAQTEQQRQALAQALGIPQPANVGLMDPRTGQATNQQIARLLSPQQQQMSGLVNALSGEQAQVLAGNMLSGLIAPQANRPAAVTEFGKINQDEQAGNISADTANFMREAARKNDARSIGEAETALRKEFNDNISGFASGLTSLQNARNLLALEDNPVGAQAALTAFVRAIDDSVVRPSEQAMYQNIFGLAQSIENRLGQLRGEGAFGPESKAEILEAVNALSKSAEDYIERSSGYYSSLAKSGGLNPYNVTGLAPQRGQSDTRKPEGKTDDESLGEVVLSIP